MPIYDIADLRVKIENPSGRTAKQAIPYLAVNQAEDDFDICINVTPERIKNSMEMHPELNENDWEYMLTGSDFYYEVLKFDGILLHSSCVVVDDVAYAFSADSGTGKSTHTELWLKRFGEKAYILNDDKPCIRIIDNKVYACGTPFSGKNDISSPKIVPLGGICFLERSENNHIRKADTKSAIFKFLAQTTRRLGPNAMDKLLDVVEGIFTRVPLYELGCNISYEAVEVSYGAMARAENEE